MAANDTANMAQRDYWNRVAGPRWVGLEGFVERRVQPVNDLLLAAAAPMAGETVLEIGCGTGAATVPLARAVGPQGAVLGADISAPMLTAARRRIAESGLGNVSFIETDAQTHAFEPGHFDLVASRFGVMFFADPRAAFANLLRATRPGGRLGFACWAGLADNPHWLVPYEIALRHLGPPSPTPPRAPGPMAFAEPDYVRGFLGAAGFAEIDIRRETIALAGATAAEEAEHADKMGPPARLIEEKQPGAALRETIRHEIEAAFAAHVENGRVRLTGTVHLVTARRPR
jgi:SAM-dependent methyltransferase